MKLRIVKRLVYGNNIGLHGETYIDSREFDGNLSDFNILGMFVEVGKWGWADEEGSMLVSLDTDLPVYIGVEKFYQYEKSWYNLLSDIIKRILRI